MKSDQRKNSWVASLRSQARQLSQIAMLVCVGALRARRPKGELLRQLYQVGNRSLLFVLVTLGFTGMVLVFQSCLQLSRVTGDLSQVGGEFIKYLVHEFGPSLTAMMLATRVGAGIAAEIGSMVVTEQVDALRMCSADPIDFLVVPRFVAGLVMTGFLIVLGGAVAFGAGALTAHIAFEVPFEVFITARSVRLGDLVTGAAKCVAYGAAIPLVSSYCGLSTFGGSEGVGWATTRAVVNSSLAILMLNFFISGVALLIFPP